MDTRISISICAVSILSVTAFADFVYPEDTIFTVPYTQFPSTSAKFRDRDGNTTNWVAGSYMVFLHETNGKWPSTTNLQGWFDVRGLRFETHYDGEYFETGVDSGSARSFRFVEFLCAELRGFMV